MSSIKFNEVVQQDIRYLIQADADIEAANVALRRAQDALRTAVAAREKAHEVVANALDIEDHGVRVVSVPGVTPEGVVLVFKREGCEDCGGALETTVTVQRMESPAASEPVRA